MNSTIYSPPKSKAMDVVTTPAGSSPYSLAAPYDIPPGDPLDENQQPRVGVYRISGVPFNGLFFSNGRTPRALHVASGTFRRTDAGGVAMAGGDSSFIPDDRVDVGGWFYFQRLREHGDWTVEQLEKWKLEAAPADNISARTRRRQQQVKINRRPKVSENDPLALDPDSYELLATIPSRDPANLSSDSAGDDLTPHHPTRPLGDYVSWTREEGGHWRFNMARKLQRPDDSRLACRGLEEARLAQSVERCGFDPHVGLNS
ncbi:hypothetical protein ACRALDRAFT_212207 [Sodiomyces alcalophilus JCM 7366]|uniref:uncharacterized protein n=1 Tax=Sodiomyces alcalophilus JCM 7366 TaxID=591952 RepID=UPI0039B592B3